MNVYPGFDTTLLAILAGIPFLSFQRLKTYTHLRPTEHDCFSERAACSEPPFQKCLRPVATPPEARFFDLLMIVLNKLGQHVDVQIDVRPRAAAEETPAHP